MGKFTKERVNDYADKLLIGLTEEEQDMVLKEFDVIDYNEKYQDGSVNAHYVYGE